MKYAARTTRGFGKGLSLVELLIAIGILAAIKLLVVTLLVLTEIPKAAVLILLAPVINIFLIWAVAKFKMTLFTRIVTHGALGNGLFALW